jgi:DNA end-binding protein Ku
MTRVFKTGGNYWVLAYYLHSARKVLAPLAVTQFPQPFRVTAMLRPSWSASIRLSLVSVPVKGYTAIESEKSRISLNQLHDKCHSRIRYQKTCPIHGEVTSDQIVMGYEYGPDQYAVVNPKEVDELRSEADRSINIDKFVPPHAIDPIYFSGQTYYLLPDGKNGEKSYAVLQQSMAKQKVVGLAQVVISNREQLVLLRPIGRLLAASILTYDAAIRKPVVFAEKLQDTPVTVQELKLAQSLIDMTRSEDAHIEEYRNLYNERMEALVEAKIAGKKIARPPEESQGPPVVNIMDALKASLERKAPRRPGSKPLGTRIRKPAAKRKSG